MAWSVLRRCYRRCFECLGCGTTRGDRGDAHSSTPLVPSSPRHPKRCLGHPRAKRSFGPARFAATRSLRSGVSVTPPTHVSTASVGRQSNVPGGAASLANPLFGRNASLEHGGLTSARSLRIGTRDEAEQASRPRLTYRQRALDVSPTCRAVLHRSPTHCSVGTRRSNTGD